MDPHDLSIRQVAEYLGVTPQRVHQLRDRQDFPRPVVIGFREAAWSGPEIRAWAESHPCGRRRWGLPSAEPLSP